MLRVDLVTLKTLDNSWIFWKISLWVKHKEYNQPEFEIPCFQWSHLTLHYNFYILIGIFGVTYCTVREASKNVFNPGQNIVNKFLKLIK